MNPYLFRGYTIYIHEKFDVVIGNQEKDFIVYIPDDRTSAQLLIHWVEETQALRVINLWALGFEIEDKTIYVYYNPDFNY